MPENPAWRAQVLEAPRHLHPATVLRFSPGAENCPEVPDPRSTDPVTHDATFNLSNGIQIDWQS